MRHKRKEGSEEQKLTKPETGESSTLRPLGAAEDGTDFDRLLDTLLQQKDELFEDTFLTEEDKRLINELAQEYRRPVLDALLKKGVLFRKLHGRLQRVSADYANFQKRTPRQIADLVAYEKEKIIKTLLPALDNFEHTLQNAPSAENIDVLVKGIRIIYDQMLDILKSHGVEQIKALGEKFDPALHQAIMQKTEPQMGADIVLEEFQKGYKLNDHVIQPSRVIVNKPSSEQSILRSTTKDEQSQQVQSSQQPDEDYETTDAE